MVISYGIDPQFSNTTSPNLSCRLAYPLGVSSCMSFLAPKMDKREVVSSSSRRGDPKKDFCCRFCPPS